VIAITYKNIKNHITHQNCKNVKEYERLMMKMGTPIEMTKKGKTKKNFQKLWYLKIFRFLRDMVPHNEEL
jgi:hypothetical protein